MCMVRSRLRHSTDAIIAVAKKLDPQTMVLIRQFVEPLLITINPTFLPTVLLLILHMTNLAKSSLSRRINSSAVHCADNWVNPQMSAKRMLKSQIKSLWLMLYLFTWHSHVSECKFCGTECRWVYRQCLPSSPWPRAGATRTTTNAPKKVTYKS